MRSRSFWVAAALAFAACTSSPQSSVGGNGGNAGSGGNVGNGGSVGGGGNAGGAGSPAPDMGPIVTQDGGTEASVLQFLERVADWQLQQTAQVSGDGWTEGTFWAGLMALYSATQAPRFLNAATSWAQSHQYKPKAQNGDNQCVGQTFVELYLLDSNAAHLTPTQQNLDAVLANPQPGRQVWGWCDLLFMAPPVYARVGKATGQATYFDSMSTMFWDVYNWLYDPASNLFFRDGSYLNQTCPNGQKMFWARGNGWVVAGTVRVLEYLPMNHPDRPKFVSLLQTMLAKLATLQKPDGYWPSCLTDAADYPEPETSGTSAFIYGMAWAVNNGLIDSGMYLPIIRKGWTALVNAVDGAGKLGWVQPPGAAPGHATMGQSENYASGLLLLAGSEVAKLAAAGQL